MPWLGVAARGAAVGSCAGSAHRVCERPAAPLGSRRMWCSGSPARARSPARATEHAQSSGRLPARNPRAHSALSGLQAAQAGVVVDRRAKTVARSRGEGGGRGSGELERCALVAGWGANLGQKARYRNLTLPVFRRRCTPHIWRAAVVCAERLEGVSWWSGSQGWDDSFLDRYFDFSPYSAFLGSPACGTAPNPNLPLQFPG